MTEQINIDKIYKKLKEIIKEDEVEYIYKSVDDSEMEIPIKGDSDFLIKINFRLFEIELEKYGEGVLLSKREAFLLYRVLKTIFEEND